MSEALPARESAPAERDLDRRPILFGGAVEAIEQRARRTPRGRARQRHRGRHAHSRFLGVQRGDQRVVLAGRAEHPQGFDGRGAQRRVVGVGGERRERGRGPRRSRAPEQQRQGRALGDAGARRSERLRDRLHRAPVGLVRVEQRRGGVDGGAPHERVAVAQIFQDRRQGGRIVERRERAQRRTGTHHATAQRGADRGTGVLRMERAQRQRAAVRELRRGLTGEAAQERRYGARARHRQRRAHRRVVVVRVVGRQRVHQRLQPFGRADVGERIQRGRAHRVTSVLLEQRDDGERRALVLQRRQRDQRGDAHRFVVVPQRQHQGARRARIAQLAERGRHRAPHLRPRILDLADQRHHGAPITEARQRGDQRLSHLRRRVVEVANERHHGVLVVRRAEGGGGGGAHTRVGIAEHAAERARHVGRGCGAKQLGRGQAQATLRIVEPADHERAGVANAQLQRRLDRREPHLEIRIGQRLLRQPSGDDPRQLRQTRRRATPGADVVLVVQIVLDALGGVRPHERVRRNRPQQGQGYQRPGCVSHADNASRSAPGPPSPAGASGQAAVAAETLLAACCSGGTMPISANAARDARRWAGLSQP